MRVLAISDLYPPDATGGYERSCADVVQCWRAAGDDVLVLTTGGETSEADGVLRALPRVARGVTEAAGRTQLILQQVLRSFRPDVVSCWNMARLDVAGTMAPVAAQAVPVVLVVCDGWLDAAPGGVAACAPGSAIAFVSSYLQRVSRPPSWAPRFSCVVPSGIDTTVFGPARRPDRSWSWRLLFVGRLVPAKGVEDALQALALLPGEATLRVLGAGSADQREHISRLAADVGLTGRVSVESGDRTAVRDAYLSCDAVLFPSRWAEPFGLVPLEAMACGTPVIATGTGGSSTYLRHNGNALLAAPRNPSGLAAAVSSLALDPELRRRLVAAGLRTSAGYPVNVLARRLQMLHRRAAAGTAS